MIMSKIKLGILCGGQSAEHEVSVNSAKNVIQALDKNKYDIRIIFINKKGEWDLLNSPELFLAHENPLPLLNDSHHPKVNVTFGEDKKTLMTSSNEAQHFPIDVIFPILHGTHGEDGTVQGLLELANIPYVGPGVLGSAICMDKDVTKRLLQNADILTNRFLVFHDYEKNKINYKAVTKKLGSPIFIKPANTGSSVGISKVKNAKQFRAAIELAFQYDHKILIEECIKGREIECAVLGNDDPQASLPGEIIVHHEFYTYEAKYIDPNGADVVIPAKNLPKAIINKIQTIAKKTFKTLCCEGMARVDFFITPRNKIYVNEVNTIPGFTQISAYPKMWMASGLSYSALLDRLIELALERFTRNRVLVKARNFELKS